MGGVSGMWMGIAVGMIIGQTFSLAIYLIVRENPPSHKHRKDRDQDEMEVDR